MRSHEVTNGTDATGPKHIPFELLKEITDDFSQTNKLGCGTFGTVYKVCLLPTKTHYTCLVNEQMCGPYFLNLFFLRQELRSGLILISDVH